MSVSGCGSAWRIPALHRIKRHLGFNDCVVPGCVDPVTIHHMVPKSKGGTDAVENLIPICERHHSLLHYGAIFRPHAFPVNRKPCSVDGCDVDAYSKSQGKWRCPEHHHAHVQELIAAKYGDKYIPNPFVNEYRTDQR